MLVLYCTYKIIFPSIRIINTELVELLMFKVHNMHVQKIIIDYGTISADFHR